jgi:hypothetical protein
MTHSFGLERGWVEPEKVMSQRFEESFSGSTPHSKRERIEPVNLKIVITNPD